MLSADELQQLARTLHPVVIDCFHSRRLGADKLIHFKMQGLQDKDVVQSRMYKMALQRIEGYKRELADRRLATWGAALLCVPVVGGAREARLATCSGGRCVTCHSGPTRTAAPS